MASTSYQELSSLTVVALKEILREQGLKVSGIKSELIERILEHRNENAGVKSPARTGSSSASKTKSHIRKAKSPASKAKSSVPKVKSPARKAKSTAHTDEVNSYPRIVPRNLRIHDPEILGFGDELSRFTLPSGFTNENISKALKGTPEPSTIYLSNLQMRLYYRSAYIDGAVDIIGSQNKVQHDTEAIRYIDTIIDAEISGVDIDMEDVEREYRRMELTFNDDVIPRRATPEEIDQLKLSAGFKRAYIVYTQVEDGISVYYDINASPGNLSWYKLLQIVKEIAFTRIRSQTYFWGFRRVGNVNGAPILVPFIERY